MIGPSAYEWFETGFRKLFQAENVGKDLLDLTDSKAYRQGTVKQITETVEMTQGKQFNLLYSC